MSLGVQTEQCGLTQNSINLINDTLILELFGQWWIFSLLVFVFSHFCAMRAGGTGSTDVSVLTFSYCSEVSCFNQIFVPYRKHSGGEKTMLQKWQVS